jgi:asparagine synthase (glutamine-hydrolysing)
VGVFAFAIWNEKTQTLFTARSPIMAPTLMYYSSSAVFAFATAPSGLHALPFVSRELNEERLSDQLIQMRGGPDDATLYRHISRLPTGFCLSAGRNGIKTRRFWQPDLNRELRFSSDEEFQEAFLFLFRRVIKDQLSSATGAAIQMSGGLDSSSVAAMAARLLAKKGETLTAFTEIPSADFKGPVPMGRYVDETPFVRAVAELHGNLDLNLVDTDSRMFLDGLDLFFPHLEAPFRNSANRVWIEAIFRETAARGVKVLLDGTQGNLTMSWNGSGLLPGLISRGKWLQAFREARSFKKPNTILPALKTIVGQGILPLLPDPLWLAVERFRNPEDYKKNSWLTRFPIHPDFARAQRLDDRARERKHATNPRPTADSRLRRLTALSTQDLGTYLCAHRSMFGVDSRTPPADVRLAEFCLALPEDQCLRNGESRRFLRRSMTSYLPEMILTNHKRGLQAADWFHRLSCGRDKVAAALSQLDQSILSRQYLDLRRMRDLFDRMPSEATAKSDNLINDYYWVLQHGLMMGKFLCWFEA